MSLLLHLVNCLVLIIFGCLSFRSTLAQPFGLWKRYQLVIYDPMSGRQLDPLQFMRDRPRAAKPNGNVITLPQLWNPCSCSDYRCICCVGMRISEQIDNRLCLILEYNAADIGLQMRIQLNQLTLANMGFSLRNPPPYCIPILLPLPISTCIRLYDLQARDGQIQLCLALMLNVITNSIFEFNFNCLRFGANGMQFTKPMRDVEQIDATDEDKIQYVRPVQQPLGSMQKLQQRPDSQRVGPNELVPYKNKGSVYS